MDTLYQSFDIVFSAFHELKLFFYQNGVPMVTNKHLQYMNKKKIHI